MALVREVINNINFSQKEKTVIEKSTFTDFTLKELAIELNLSISALALIKSSAYSKIYLYVISNKKILEKISNNTETK